MIKRLFLPLLLLAACTPVPPEEKLAIAYLAAIQSGKLTMAKTMQCHRGADVLLTSLDAYTLSPFQVTEAYGFNASTTVVTHGQETTTLKVWEPAVFANFAIAQNQKSMQLLGEEIPPPTEDELSPNKLCVTLQ